MEATTAVMWLTLITMATPTGDNATEAGFDYNVTTLSGKSPSSSSSSSPISYSPYYVDPTLAMVIYVTTCIIAALGSLANGYVLLAMLFSKNSRSSNVNAFITHQTILDLTACVFLFIGLMPIPNATNDSLGLFLCWFFGTHAVSIAAGNASTCGLMIITIERYVKIVHPVTYRNRYRPWMTCAGIIIPWIYGICTNLIPAWATATFVRGRCIRGRVGSNREEQLAWSVTKFLLLYVVPLAVFIFGYSKILGVIRRQRKQVGQSRQQGTSNAATAAATSSKRSEMNVIKTVVLVSVTFAVCFVWSRTYSILTALKVLPTITILYMVFSVFMYSSRCVNPFIYATQYEVVRRWWRVMVCRVVRRQHVEEASLTMSAGPDTGEKQEASKARMTMTTKNL